jgi:3-dehydroquinate dehydratase-2
MSRLPQLLIINGPNLNLLGKREPDVYGDQTLEDLEVILSSRYQGKRAELEFFQSNVEGEIINKIHEAHQNQITGIIINPGAYTHYAIGIHDAVKAITVPVIEVHISNIHAREEFRQKSVIAPAALGQISGLGFKSYMLAIEYFLLD